MPCCPDLQDGAPAGTIFAEDIEDVREDYEESQKDSSKVNNTFTHTLTNTLTPSQPKHVPSQQMHVITTYVPTPPPFHTFTIHTPTQHTSPHATSHISPHTHTTYLHHTQHTLTTHPPHLTTCPYHSPSSQSRAQTPPSHEEKGQFAISAILILNKQ